MNRTQKILSLAKKQNQDNIQECESTALENGGALNNLLTLETGVVRANADLETSSNLNTKPEVLDIQNAPIVFLDNNIIIDYITDNNTDILLSNNNNDGGEIFINTEDVEGIIQLDEHLEKENEISGNKENIQLNNFKVGVRLDNFKNNVKLNNNVHDDCSENEIDQNLTKKGTKRKRRRYKSSLGTRKNRKIEKQKSVHKVFQPCGENCRKKCRQSFTEEERFAINESFWNLNYIARRVFIMNSTVTKPIQRRRGSEDSTRQNTFEYYLKTATSRVQVCKTFFLTTLGFSKNNNTVVQSVLSQNNHSPKPDGRGRHAKRKIERAVIHTHVESFHPCVSHYRREHAPNKRYLPSDITIQSMYKDFTEKHSKFKCSYDLYRSIVSEMKISFTKLGHEECESCEFFRLHDTNHSKENLVNDCGDCIKWKCHIDKANAARQKYREDGKIANDEKDVVFSADLQKVIMLPRMDTFKIAVFTQRIIAFNQTFAPVGKKHKENPLAVVWHEAITGRKKEDIVSAFYQFFFISTRCHKHNTLARQLLVTEQELDILVISSVYN